MSYIDDLEQAAAEALAASSSSTDSAQIMADVANGDENTTVTTANGEVKTLAKAIKDIIDSIEAGVEAPQVEPQTLSAGQTTVTLSTMTTEGIAVYVEGSREFDFNVVNSTDFDFSQSFPDGTRIWVVKRDIEGVADSFTINTATGSQTLTNALDQRVIYVDTLADLQALPTGGLVDGQELHISTTERAGKFVVRVGDFSTEVTNDPESGVWVAFDDDPTGGSIVAMRTVSIGGDYDAGWWGAPQDGASSDTVAVNAAQKWISENGGGYLNFKDIYAGGGGFLLRSNVVMAGRGIGNSTVGALPGWSGNIVETYDFANLEASETADTADGCPVSYGITDATVNGDGYDGVVSSTQGYGVRLYGRQLYLSRLIIGRIAGIGLYTSFPSPTTFTNFDAITDNKFSGIKDILVMETGKEGFVFNGPTDQYLDNVFIGFPAGSRFDSYDTTGPKTSDLFTGEPVHGFRCLRSTEFGFIHSFDNEYGYSVHVKRQAGNPAIRFQGSYLMGETSYGGVYIDPNVEGGVSLIETHNNSRGPTAGGSYSADAGANPHIKIESTLGFLAKIICRRQNDEHGSSGIVAEGASLDIDFQVLAFDASFTGGGKGFVNDSLGSRITGSVASKADANTLSVGFEEAATAGNNVIDVDSRFCDVNFEYLGGAGSDTGSVYKIKTRGAVTTEISNIARLATEPYMQSDIITDDGVNKLRNRFVGGVAVDFSVTGLQTLSIPYGASLVRDPTEPEVTLTVSYDSGTFPGIAKLGVSNIDTVNKEIDVFIECEGGAVGTGKINARVG